MPTPVRRCLPRPGTRAGWWTTTTTPCPAGTPGSKVLITNLVNSAQPLIRYELSEAATPSEGSNPAGRPYRRLASVDGRSADILQLPARGGGSTAVHPPARRSGRPPSPRCSQYQCTLDERGLHARVVLAPDASRSTAENLRRSLVRAIEATAPSRRVDVEEASALRREPSGKIRLVTVPMSADTLLRAAVLAVLGGGSVSKGLLRSRMTSA